MWIFKISDVQIDINKLQYQIITIVFLLPIVNLPILSNQANV